MTVEQAEKVQELLEEEGYDVTIHPEYSGRGMYGKTVVGISVSTRDALVVGWACAKAGLNLDGMPGRTDSMGRDTIFY